jgi:5S rRNA maturation endonuclease (ribonuclease M5)
VPEGEKDADAIESVRGMAVCSAMGAGKAHLADWTPLKGLDVIIVQDKDEKGRDHADDIVQLLQGRREIGAHHGIGCGKGCFRPQRGRQSA